MILLSWDMVIAIFVAIASFMLLSPLILNSFAKDIYSVGISVLSIVFSVYFAALAIIISSSDDEFVRYLIKFKHYDLIISAFKWTLLYLFVALVYSLILYAISSSWMTEKADSTQPKLLFTIFAFLFTLSIFAAFFATRDALKYASTRAKFITQDKKD